MTLMTLAWLALCAACAYAGYWKGRVDQLRHRIAELRAIADQANAILKGKQ